MKTKTSIFRVLYLLVFLMAIELRSAPPNFVMFITDDQGVYHSNPYGADWMRTPNMQSLADDGLKFTRAYVASPSCAPSRAALLTGLIPYNNGIVGNHENIKKDGVEALLPILSKQGYEIAWYGKVGHGRAWYTKEPGITMIPYSRKAEKGAFQRLDITDVENFIRNREDPDR